MAELDVVGKRLGERKAEWFRVDLAGATGPHDHDGEYAPVHTHPYAANDHAHPGGDGEHPDLAAHQTLGLAGDDHTHDTTHDHDASYSGTAHTHAGGDHPDLTAHTDLGLASTHAHPYSADDHGHADLATDDDLTTHAAATHGTTAHAIGGVMHSGTLDHSALGSVTANQHHNQAHALGGADHSGSLAQSSVTNLTADLAGKAASVHTHDYAATSHSHLDADIPAAIARDAEVTSAIATHAATPHGGSSERYKVGDLYITTTSYADAAAVATAEGYGTWARFGVGRFLLLTDGTAGQTGGSATHSHSFTQPDAHTGIIDHTHAATVTDPQHAHVQGVNSATTGGLSGYTPDTSSNTRVNSGYSTSNAATGITVANASPAGAVASLAHANGAVANGSTEPLSITAYAWLRTA